MGRQSRQRSWRSVVIAACLALVIPSAATEAHAHGGAYQPPPQPRNGGPESGPATGGGRGPVTPSGNPGKGPTTGDTDSGGGMPGTGSGGTPGRGDPSRGAAGGSPFAPTGNPGGVSGSAPRPPAGVRGSSGLTVVDFNAVGWARWWFANRSLLLRWSARAAARPDGPVTPSATMGRHLGDPLWRAKAQAALTKALSSDNRSIASAAAVALGKSGDPEEAAALVRVLLDEERPQTVREGAALGLGLLPRDAERGGRLALRTLEDLGSNPRETDRLRAMCVYALGLRGDTASIPYLLEAAAGGGATWDIPAAGVSALGLAGHEMLLPDLLDMLEGPRRARNREAVRRAYAAQALAMLGDVRAVPTLREAALDTEEHARRSAVLALGAVADASDDKTTDVLLHQLNNSRDIATRCVAALSLGRIGSERAAPALRYSYRKGSLRLRPFAAIGLGLLARHAGLEDSTQCLLYDLRNRADPQLRASLCVAVGLAAEKGAASILGDIVEGDDPIGLRAHAAFSLGLIGEREESPELLRRVLSETRAPELQREVSLALGLLGDRAALGILEGLVRHGGSAYVQGSAAVAVGRIGGKESVDPLVSLLEDELEPDMGRAMAAVGLGLVLDRSEGRRMARIAGDLNWWLFTPTVLEVLSIH